MSIIYDALKKAEPSEEVKQVLLKKQGRKKLKTVLLYILAVIVGLYVSNQFFGFLTPSKYIPVAFTKPLLAKKAPSAPAPSWPPQPSKKEAPGLLENLPHLPTSKKETKTLTLNGIFFSKEQGYALINNRVVKQGDMVGGARVIKIEAEEVELDQDGNLVKLSTR